MRDTNLVNALREHADLVEALTGDSGLRHMVPQVDSSDFPTQWMPSALECSIFDAQVKEIIKLRRKVPRWIPVADILPELETPVLVIDRQRHKMVRTLRKLASDKEPVFRPDGLVPGKHITHWMPLPTDPEVK